MIFDRLAKTVENLYPDLKIFLDRSRLFWINENPHEFLRDEIPTEEVELMKKTFFLPFQVTAIEDNAGVVVLIDKDKNAEGLCIERNFIEFLTYDTPTSAFNPNDPYIEQYHEENVADPTWKDKQLIAVGSIRVLDDITKTIVPLEGRCQFINLVSNSKEIVMDINTKKPEILQKTLSNVLVAIQEVMYCNTPSKFVVESIPQRRPKKRKKANKKIKRSHERPLYTLLTPGEIRKRYDTQRNEDNTRKSPQVHERRKHYRNYPDDPNRWPKAYGKTVIIPARWIGETTFRKNKRIYKVRVDL